MATKNTPLTPGQKAAATKAAAKAAAVKTPAKKVAAKTAPVKAAAKKTAPVKTAPVKAVAAIKEARVKVTKPEKAVAVESDEPQGPFVSRKDLAPLLIAELKEQGFAAPDKLVVAYTQAFEKVITAQLAAGVEVVLPGFGKFKVSGGRASFKVGKQLKAAASGVPAAADTPAEAAAPATVGDTPVAEASVPAEA